MEQNSSAIQLCMMIISAKFLSTGASSRLGIAGPWASLIR